MENEIREILTAWMAYIKKSGIFYKEVKTADNLLHNYDPNGIVTAIYAKSRFDNFLSNQVVSLLKIIREPEYIKEEQELFKMLHSETLDAAESKILDSLHDVLCKVSGKTEIGSRDPEAERKALYACIESTAESLSRLKLDVYKIGGPVNPVSILPTQVFVFNTLAECVMALENSPDGMRICYIRNNDTADGYFGFFIRSNGNLFSLHERIDEAFYGEHERRRNGRWTEEKAEDLFPYELFDFGERDYKGYAHEFKIDEIRLQFKHMKETNYFPMVLAILLLMQKYNNIALDGKEIVYSHLMLPENQPMLTDQPETAALVANSQYALESVQAAKRIETNMTTEKILNGEWDRSCKFRSVVMADQTPDSYIQKIIDRYGKGFELDKSRLLQNDTIPPEFIGNEKRIEMEMYRQGRAQLADYIQQKMYEEYRKIGGYQAVMKDFHKQLVNHWEEIEAECVRIWNRVIVEPECDIQPGTGSESCIYDAEYMPCYIFPNTQRKWPETLFNLQFVNGKDRKWDDPFLCPVTKKAASVFFIFSPANQKHLVKVLGEDVPEALQMWHADNISEARPNPLLNATDPVQFLNTPFMDAYESTARNAQYSEYSKIDKELTGGFFAYRYLGFTKDSKFICAWSLNGWKKILQKYNTPAQ